MPSAQTPKTIDLNRSVFYDLASWANESPTSIEALYNSPHATQAIFRALPPIARLYVYRLLYLPSKEPSPTLHDFRSSLRRRQRAIDRHEASVQALISLRVLTSNEFLSDTGLPAPDAPLGLSHAFANNLRQSLAGGVLPIFGGSQSPTQLSTEEMDVFSAKKLEHVLNFLVESSGGNAPGSRLLRGLLATGILESRRDGMCITSVGFQFLLKDSFAQLWVLVRCLLLTQFSGSEQQAFELIFSLAFAVPGRLYADAGLEPVQRQMLEELHGIGIVMMEDGGVFRPTSTGVRLLSSGNRVSTGPSSVADVPRMAKTAGEIEVFVETNFRVYAYTTSSFQINLLALFTHMRYRLPNMVVGHLTRDAVRKALMNGITGDQIIGYLNAHAHPRMKKGAIPANVSDEIRLWEAEQDRVQTRPGVLLGDFQSDGAFEQVLAYANDIGAMLWNDASKKQVVIAKEGYESVKSFVQTHGIQ